MKRPSPGFLFLLSKFFHHDTALALTPSSTNKSVSRRQWYRSLVSAGGAGLAITSTLIDPSFATEESSAGTINKSLPKQVRKYTVLAPLGDPSNSIGGDKQKNLSLEDIAGRLSIDLTRGANNRGGYFISGDLSPELFRDNCLFIDPTNSVASLSRYQRALEILFDPDESSVELLEPLTVDSATRTISARIQSDGILRLPWRPRVAPYQTNILYKLDADGLIEEQSQTWSISSYEALRETFTPGFLSPTRSRMTTASAPNEPREVASLFNLINGRRPQSYTDQERREIDKLIDMVASVDSPSLSSSWQRRLLPGTWRLAYLQPGPDGGGVDRRIPFPELPFNESYQRFTEDTVLNVGELLGPAIEVRVSGSLEESDVTDLKVPKRFVANINQGKICALGHGEGRGGGICAPLPIEGRGLFDGVYLGERLRIGQNLNGGGARVVQVRIA